MSRGLKDEVGSVFIQAIFALQNWIVHHLPYSMLKVLYRYKDAWYAFGKYKHKLTVTSNMRTLCSCSYVVEKCGNIDVLHAISRSFTAGQLNGKPTLKAQANHIMLSQTNSSLYSSWPTQFLSMNIYKNGLLYAQQCRFIHFPIPFKKNQDMRLLDKVHGHYERIYKTTVDVYLVYFYPTTALFSLGGISFCLFSYFNNMNLFSENIPEPVNDTILLYDNSFQLIIPFVFTAFVTYVARNVIMRCPLRIYCNDNFEFIAIFATLFPWRVSKVKMLSGDVKSLGPLEEVNPKFWHAFTGNHTFKNKRLIIYPHLFKYPHYYNSLAGYTLEHMSKDTDKT